MTEAVFYNARVVTATNVFAGHVQTRDGLIRDIAPGSTGVGTIDCAGDYLIPGLIELHTDHLEAHFNPRPGVLWPAAAAVLAHDAQIAASGITTVFDALRIGTSQGDGIAMGRNTRALATAIGQAKAAGALRADHMIHLRCELACEDTAHEAEAFVDNADLRLISLMDHTPGQRQFTRIEKFREYYSGKLGLSEAQLDAFITERQEAHARLAAPTRHRIVALARQRGIPLASHDDATAAHVDVSVADGVSIAEFPTTAEAAASSRRRGLSVLMGAPNVVRGGSHSGNVSAQALAECGLLDALSSDYVPCSLLQATFDLPRRVPAIDLPAAIRLVTDNPATAVRLDDRGRIAIGRRADLVRVGAEGPVPVVRGVWRAGRRVA